MEFYGFLGKLHFFCDFGIGHIILAAHVKDTVGLFGDLL